MSPELFDPEIENHNPTEYSDRYALGMVMYEVLSGHAPFYTSKIWAVSGKVLKGDRPERPQGAEGVWFIGEIWKVLQTCWTHQAENRARIEDVLQCLEEVSRSWIPPSPRLVVVPSTADSLAQGFSDIVTTEGVGASGPSQPPGKVDREESAGIVDQVRSTSERPKPIGTFDAQTADSRGSCGCFTASEQNIRNAGYHGGDDCPYCPRKSGSCASFTGFGQNIR